MKNKHFFKHTALLLFAVLLLSALLPVQTEAKTTTKKTKPDYSLVFDANYYYDTYADVRAAFGKNPILLFNHFINNGMNEGRQGCKAFNVFDYARNNLDLVAKYGYSNLKAYYIQYITEGHEQGRNCEKPYTIPDDDDDDDNTAGDLDEETLRSYETTAFDIINQLRENYEENKDSSSGSGSSSSDDTGIPVLTRSSSLDSVARERAAELISRYSHTRPNGSNFLTALNNAGIGYQNAYEIISKGQSSPGRATSEWMADSGISTNLMNKQYDYGGVGCAEDEDGNLYWVMLVTY